MESNHLISWSIPYFSLREHIADKYKQVYASTVDLFQIYWFISPQILHFDFTIMLLVTWALHFLCWAQDGKVAAHWICI